MLKEITDRSWIEQNRVGKYVHLLLQTDDGYFLFDAKNRVNSRPFADRETLNEYFGRDIFQNMIKGTGVKERAEVNGWPCNADNPVIATELSVEHGLPVFFKAKNQKTSYVAGYFIYKTAAGKWSKAFCPKLDTLVNATEKRGPFANETEQLGELDAVR